MKPMIEDSSQDTVDMFLNPSYTEQGVDYRNSTEDTKRDTGADYRSDSELRNRTVYSEPPLALAGQSPE